MTDDYKAGYENGRLAVLEELRNEVRKHCDPLSKKIENGGVNSMGFGQLSAFDTVEAWLASRLEELSDD